MFSERLSVKIRFCAFYNARKQDLDIFIMSAGAVAHLVLCLPTMHETLSLLFSTVDGSTQ